MRKLLMVRYGEIYLKGLNRPYFLKALVKRVKEAAKPFGGQVWLHDARVFISDAEDMEGCMQPVAQQVCLCLGVPHQRRGMPRGQPLFAQGQAGLPGQQAVFCGAGHGVPHLLNRRQQRFPFRHAHLGSNRRRRRPHVGCQIG